MNDTDHKLLNDVIEFNSFDLYSKEDKDFKFTDDIKYYYEDLLNEFFPTELPW